MPVGGFCDFATGCPLGHLFLFARVSSSSIVTPPEPNPKWRRLRKAGRVVRRVARWAIGQDPIVLPSFKKPAPSSAALSSAPQFSKRHPELASFLLRESTFFPNLAWFGRHVRDSEIPYHSNGAPDLIGEPKLDAQLVARCAAMNRARFEIPSLLLEIRGLQDPKAALRRAQLLELVRLREETINREKFEARRLLLKAVRRLRAKYKRDPRKVKVLHYPRYPPLRALRLFLSEEMGTDLAPLVYGLRNELAQLENEQAHSDSLLAKRFHYANGRLRITGDSKTDRQIDYASVRVFGLRNRIRKAVLDASLSDDPAASDRFLEKARDLEARIDHEKFVIRRALVELKLGDPLRQK